MPPRPPPKPFALTVLSTLSAVAAGCILVAIEQVGRGFGWAAFGVEFGGAVLALVVALAANAVASALRVAGWLQSLSLAGLVLAVFWLPTALVASALPGGNGPVADVYRSLGDPPAGRWGAAGLAVVLWWLLAGVASRRAVATGRAWMRADALEFRRRLVRVVAGWPVAITYAALAAGLGWMPPVFAVAWGAVLLLGMVIRTA